MRVDIDGDVVAKETAWAAGTRFTSSKNWATYVSATIKDCTSTPEGDLNSNTDATK
jgi:triosephosphate isomerase